MRTDTYDQLRTTLHRTAEAIAAAKRPEYTIDSVDVLANFKGVAARLGLTPLQAWGVYFLKHIDAICAIAKDPTRTLSEPPIGRFADALNYIDLGWALFNEELQHDSEHRAQELQTGGRNQGVSRDLRGCQLGGDASGTGGAASDHRVPVRSGEPSGLRDYRVYFRAEHPDDIE